MRTAQTLATCNRARRHDNTACPYRSSRSQAVPAQLSARSRARPGDSLLLHARPLTRPPWYG
jgi:hypothetical protein